ncbi:hypothetical protein WJX73_005117 [Symbiochloris irregularis]|uniref:Uncharacterized protein n=1 Tax=Symbiochloris irregularis TaxID=706552 RepID=A0AAW1PFL4_9CHLO
MEQSSVGIKWQLQGYAEEASLSLLQAQQSALSQLYQSCCVTQGACANWPRAGSETNFNFCGVTNQRCDAQGCLVGLNFTGMNLTCALPSAQLSTFTALESLSLSGVALTNQLPEFASTAAVQSLTANASQVTGSVPVGASGAQSLVQLTLGGNNLRGSLSQGLAQATNLKQLNLSNNLLLGSVPSGFVTNGNLNILDLGRNSFRSLDVVWTGRVSGQAATSGLEYVDLSFNNLQVLTY